MTPPCCCCGCLNSPAGWGHPPGVEATKGGEVKTLPTAKKRLERNTYFRQVCRGRIYASVANLPCNRLPTRQLVGRGLDPSLLPCGCLQFPGGVGSPPGVEAAWAAGGQDPQLPACYDRKTPIFGRFVGDAYMRPVAVYPVTAYLSAARREGLDPSLLLLQLPQFPGGVGSPPGWKPWQGEGPSELPKTSDYEKTPIFGRFVGDAYMRPWYLPCNRLPFGSS